MAEFYVGAAKREITPALGKNLAGNPIDRSGPACRVDTPLYVRVISMFHKEERILMISADLLAVDLAFTDALRERINKKYGVPHENIMTLTTHTHGGPEGILQTFGGLDTPDNDLICYYRELFLRAVDEAITNEKPAKFGVGSEPIEGIASNRRALEGPINPNVTVLKFDDENNRPLAALIHYTCHPTLGNFEYAYTADFPGYAAGLLEEQFGQGFVCLYANGAAGDISTRFTRKALGNDEARRMGIMLGEKALSILNTIETGEPKALGVSRQKIRLNMRKFPPLNVLLDMEKHIVEKIEEGKKLNLPQAQQRTLEIDLVGTQMARMYVESMKNQYFITETQAIALDEFVIIGVPGELFVEEGKKITKALDDRSIVIGYANDYIGYLMPAEELEKGGYEALTAVIDPNEIPRLVNLSIQTGKAALKNH
ncbi:MAG: hypothetical protein GX892_15295 [Thermoanaerobacteraceae bacterium]|nr:hypothetical protein [Thermoanaerobacteraceae bacterium]